MPRFVNFWTPLALSFLTLSLAACSMTRAKEKPVVEVRTVFVIPPQELRGKCVDPVTVSSKTTRDIRDNSLARKSAYEQCAIRMNKLLGWLDEAEKLQATNAEK